MYRFSLEILDLQLISLMEDGKFCESRLLFTNCIMIIVDCGQKDDVYLRFPTFPFLLQGCNFSYICRNFCIHEVQIPKLSFISSLFWRLLAQIHTGVFPSGHLTSLLPILFSYFVSISYTSSICRSLPPPSSTHPYLSMSV